MPAGLLSIFMCDNRNDGNFNSILDVLETRNEGFVHIIPSTLPVLKGGDPRQMACYAACENATLSLTDWWFVGVRHDLQSRRFHVSGLILFMDETILLVGRLNLPDTCFSILTF